MFAVQPLVKVRITQVPVQVCMLGYKFSDDDFCISNSAIASLSLNFLLRGNDTCQYVKQAGHDLHH